MEVKIPNSIDFANLPTKIEKLEKLSKSLGDINIYIKRDDQTGMEIAGNKVRKLEFAVQEALEEGCDYLITCGGIQSNHARATAAVAAKLGLGAHLVLRGSAEEGVEGNYFLNKLLGAEVQLITPEAYREHRMEIMEKIKADLAKKGHKGYILPEGASNGIGTFGYYKAMEEIVKQEKEMGIKFDAIVATVGSGGTYAGLLYYNATQDNDTTVYGVNVCDTAEHFQGRVVDLIKEASSYTGEKVELNKEAIPILDGYVGGGYGLNTPEQLAFIRDFAKLEGIILDPVYTGKAMYGMVEEIKKGTFNQHKNILFIHTGGLFGLFSRASEFF